MVEVVRSNKTVLCYQQLFCDILVPYLTDTSNTSIEYPLDECCSNATNSVYIETESRETCLTTCTPLRCYSSNTCSGKLVYSPKGTQTVQDCCSVGNSMTMLSSISNHLVCIQCPPKPDDLSGIGLDPHFAVLLPSGHQLCFTVQGEQGFVFNLIQSPQLIVNALFVPDSVRNEVTWIGSLAVTFKNGFSKISNKTTLRFEAANRTIYINEENNVLVQNIGFIEFSDTHLEITGDYKSQDSNVHIHIKKIGLKFTVNYINQHLDILFHLIPSSDKGSCDYHGILGQFFCEGHNIDEVRKLLLFPTAEREPVPVMRRPIWSFMERESGTPDHLCWMAMNVGYQGEGLIQGHYLKYICPDLFSLSKIGKT